ncbi:MAG: S8 family serine peptidase, partial [Pseudomonadota bacterium]
MRSLFLLLAVLALSACAAGSTAQQTPPWRLVAATDAAGERHVVVTITRADQAAQDALAEALEADHSLSLIAEWPLVSIDVHCLVFRLEPGADDAAVLTALRSDPRIRTAQPMQRFATAAIAADRDLSKLQDAHALLMLDRAHTVSTGEGVRIGVIDTLADTSHPDLSESVRIVRDFVGEQATPTAETHGTAIAGIIGAEAASGRGIVGVAPDAEILSLRACWETTRGMPGECSTFSLARALNFAILQEIDVINMSIGGPYDPLLDE